MGSFLHSNLWLGLALVDHPLFGLLRWSTLPASLCSVGQLLSLSSGPAGQLASPCHLNLESPFSVSSAFGRPSWLLDCSALSCSCSGHPALPSPFFSSSVPSHRYGSPSNQSFYDPFPLPYKLGSPWIMHHHFCIMFSLSSSHVVSLSHQSLRLSLFPHPLPVERCPVLAVVSIIPHEPPVSLVPVLCIITSPKKRGGGKEFSFSAIL